MYTGHLLLICVLSLLLDNGSSEERCPATQYLEIGKTATIHCQSDAGFVMVQWYDTANIAGEEPVIVFRDGAKHGAGYESGDFDIHPNGSLIIKTVSTQHDKTFSVYQFESFEQEPATYLIDAKTYVIPTPPYPVAMDCVTSPHNDVCLYHWTNASQLTCTLSRGRPTLPLAWQSDEQNITFGTSVDPDDITETVSVTISDNILRSPYMTLLICKAEDPHGFLEKRETLVMVQNREVDYYSLDPIKVNVERGTKINLTCWDVDVDMIAWERQRSQGAYETLVFGIADGGEFDQYSPGEYELAQDGSLVITVVDIGHDGVYTGVYSNRSHEGHCSYDVDVFVNPDPAYPIIEGCDHDRYCTLNVGLQGSLTCSIKGIRPEVTLRWKQVFDRTSAESIEFSGERTKIKSNGETSDVILTTHYTVSSSSASTRITVECGTASGGDTFPSPFTTSIDLLVSEYIPENVSSPWTPTPSWLDVENDRTIVTIVIAVVSVLGAVILGAVIFICWKDISSSRCLHRFMLHDKKVENPSEQLLIDITQGNLYF